MTRSAEHGAMAEVGSPVDLPPDPIDRADPARWTSVTIAVATLVLLVLNAHALGGWFEDLEPGPQTARLGPPIEAWVSVTERLGLDAPRAAMRAHWQAAKAARFGNEQAGEEGAGDAQ